MNILYTHRTQGRGVERVHITGIVNALKDMGHHVDILSVPGAEIDEKEEQTDIIRKRSTLGAISKSFPQFLFEFFELLYNVIQLFRLPLQLRKKKYDFIYERYSLFTFATVLICKIIGKPVILEINDSVIVPRVRPCFFLKTARFLEKFIFKHAHSLVIISTNFKNLIEEAYGPINSYVISPNAVELRQFMPTNASRELRESLNISEQSAVCGYIGAFHKWHGIEWFIKDYIARFKQNTDLGITLVMVGDGPLYSEMKALIEDEGLSEKIILTGRVQHKYISDYISLFDFCIMPDSNSYGSPMKIFEYMAMSKGVLAPSYGPIAETVKDKQTGWLTEVNNHNDFISRLFDIASDKNALKDIGLNARQYIVNERQWKHNAEQFLELLP